MRCRSMMGLALLLCTLPGLACAAPRGTALVIGIGTYDNKPLLPACLRVANAVAAHLRANGFAVDELTDPGGIVLRSAVGDFADSVLSKSPSAPALVYVCARASTLDHRIFLLPSDATPEAMLRLQTEGTVLRALMNTFTGNNAMLVADLGMSANAADIQAAAADRPDALHVALRAGLGDRLGRFGELLADSKLDESAAANTAVPSGAVWDRLSAKLRADADPEAGVAVAVTPASAVAQPSAMPAASAAAAPQTALPPSTAAASLPPPAGAAGVAPSPNVAASPEPQPKVAAVPLASPNVLPAAPAPESPVASSFAAPPPSTSAASQPSGPQNHPASAPPQRLATVSPAPPHPASVAPMSRTTAPPGDSRTSRIQEALAQRGFYHGPIDGVEGLGTTAAIRAFQVSLGDSPSGGLSRIEVVKLLSAW